MAPEPTLVTRNLTVEYDVYIHDMSPGKSLLQRRNRTMMRTLDDVTFTAYLGERIGVVGPNGAGKTTLLRAVAGLVPIASGEVWAKSQPLFLGVGGAASAQLTGRDYARVSLLSLGMTDEDALDVLPEVIDFSEIGEFLDIMHQEALLLSNLVEDVLVIPHAHQAVLIAAHDFLKRTRIIVTDPKHQFRIGLGWRV